MTNFTKEGLKDIIKSILQIHSVEETKINEIVSDNFINELYTLLQNENDNFVSFFKNISSEQNLITFIDTKQKIKAEFTKNGYLSSIFQCIIDNCRNIDFSDNTEQEISLYSLNNNVDPEYYDKALTIRDIIEGVFKYKFPDQFKTFFGEAAFLKAIIEAIQNHIEKFYQIADDFYDEMMKIARGIWNDFNTAQSTRSPLVLDIDGDGVETIGTNNGIYFDHDNNGFAENTGWAGADDGLLVRDTNNNGSIDNGTELFGNNTILSSGQNAQNGFDALADLDSNKDGVFNSSDTAWNEVKVWKDSNSDATVNEGELITLENANINAINLSYNEQDVTDDNGNQHLQTGTFNKTNETTGTISDVWFATDMANTIDKTEIEIPENIASLPNVQGFGQIYWR